MIPEAFNIKYFTSMMNSVSEGIAIIGKSGKAIWINNAFPVLLNLSASACYELDFSVFFTDPNPDIFLVFRNFGHHLQHHYIPIEEEPDKESCGIIVLSHLQAPSYPEVRIAPFSLNIASNVFQCTEELHSLLEFDPGVPVSFRDFLDRVNPSDRHLIEEYVLFPHSSDSSYTIETRIFLPSGRSFQARLKADVEHHKEKQYTRFLGTIADISAPQESESALVRVNGKLSSRPNTELQRLNDDLESTIAQRTQELELSNERFRLLTKATNDIAWDWNLIDNHLTFNEIFDTDFGSNAYKGTNGLEYWQSRLHPEDKEAVLNELFKSIHNPEIQSWKAEYRLLSRHGHYEFILDRGYIIRDEQLNPVRMVGSMLKMSDVKVIESKLRTTEQMYQILAESMPQLVYSVNAKGHGDYFNLRWLEYLGSLPKNMTKDMWSDIVFPDDLPVIRQAWIECSQTQRDLSAELRLRNKEGEYRWFLTRATPILDDDNCIIRWIGTSTDIHDQKTQLENLEKSEQQLNHDLTRLNFTNQHLAKLNKELDSFIHIASHDLRNPIKNMEFLLNMMQEELKSYLTTNDNLRQIFSLVQKSNKVLKNLVIDLTEIPVSNEEDNEIPELVDVGEILNDVLTSIGDLIIENDPDLHIDLQIKKLHIRPKEIRSILFNLINNAIKYRSDSRRPVVKISFNYSSGKDKLVLKVEDNGIGIAQEDQSKVFIPFKRLHKVSPGLGLGMSLVKQTIEKNGGVIEVCSEVDKGTIFTITLPASLI